MPVGRAELTRIDLKLRLINTEAIRHYIYFKTAFTTKNKPK